MTAEHECKPIFVPNRHEVGGGHYIYEPCESCQRKLYENLMKINAN